MSLPQDGAAGVLGVTGVVVSFFSICVDTSFEGMHGEDATCSAQCMRWDMERSLALISSLSGAIIKEVYGIS